MAGTRNRSAGVGRVGLLKRGRTWYGRFTADGRRIEVPLRVSNKARAEALAGKINEALEAGEPWEFVLGRTPSGEKTFSDVMDEWLTQVCSWAETTRRRYTGTINRLRQQFGDKPISKITRRDIETYLARRRDAGLARSSSNRYLHTIRGIFKMAEAWGYIKASPAAGIKTLREDAKLPRPYQDEEIERLRQVLSPWHRDLLTLFLETGCRLGEIQRLCWSDVDLANREITVRGTKSGRDRTIPMSANVKAIFHRMHRERRSAPVVPLDDTVIGTKANFYRVLLRAYPKAGIDPQRVEWLRPIHSLRDTTLTRLVRAGVPLDRVKAIAGHETLAMTLRYAHTSNESLHEAVTRTFDAQG